MNTRSAEGQPGTPHWPESGITRLAAAHTPGQWSFSSHGLELPDTKAKLTDIRVQPKQIKYRRGAYQVVSSTTGSPEITGPVSLAALWSSLPDLGREVPLPDSAFPLALGVVLGSQTPYGHKDESGKKTVLYTPPEARIYVKAPVSDETGREAWFKNIIANYPTAAQWQPTFSESDFKTYGDSSAFFVTIRAPDQEPTKERLTEEQKKVIYDPLAPLVYNSPTGRCLRPTVEGNGKLPPSTLMTWWLLLYSFSMLARYQPRKWVELLDLDRSRSAVHIRYFLETALSAIPQLILGALDGRLRERGWFLSL
jgi:hypothetical protein